MGKELRIDDPSLVLKARESTVVIIGDRRFIALESIMTVEDGAGLYEIDDEEAEMLRQAVADTRPRLRGADVDEYLARRLKEFGHD